MICRLCLSKNEEQAQVSLFNAVDKHGEHNLVKIIDKYIHLKIMHDDAVSTAICLKCHKNLKELDAFCKHVEYQQKKLKEFPQNFKSEPDFGTRTGTGRLSLTDDTYLLPDYATDTQISVEIKCEPEEHNDFIITEFQPSQCTTDSASEFNDDNLRRNRSIQNDESEYPGRFKRHKVDSDNRPLTHENKNKNENECRKAVPYVDKKFEQITENICTEDQHQANAENISANAGDDDTKQLKELLNEFDLYEVFPYLKDAKVTFRSLKYMRHDDVKEALPPLGLRMEFREKLFLWRKKFAIDDETSSAPSKVQDWLNKREDCFQTTSPVLNRVLNKDLLSLLKETAKGKALFEMYKINQKLSNSNRDDLINIIVEEIIINNYVLNQRDFKTLVEDICTLFPAEITAQEYYYIRRNGKKNPSGKLFMKYANKRAKKNKNKILSPSDIECIEIDYEIDDTNVQVLRESLRRDNSNWAEVQEEWQKTFGIRQKDLKILCHIDFLKSWPKLSDTRAPELINIDFKILFPKKEDSIFSKWQAFKEAIKPYYEVNLHNKTCKQLFALTNGNISIDSQDYILAILLNGVLPPTSRFKDQSGKTHKKMSIADSIECFVLHLTAINDYEKQIKDLITKYYFTGLTTQPFIIVEGVSQTEISNFYVYFDKKLYKMDSFLQSLDICFKFFQTLSLKYPQACEAPWVFIQQYFFNIRTGFDCKSANITSLLNFLDSK